MSTVKTRFAPSPTGRMHVGNLRTALYAFLIAKHEDGKFMLRIEDTDQERFMEGALEIIYRTMEKTGLIHDEGPDKDGGVGPYVQSERQAQGIYMKYAKQLIEQGDAYYCFCDKERLESLKTEVAGKEISIYDKHCLHLSKEEIERIFAIFRFINPKAIIKIAGGRELLNDKGLGVFKSGANGAITGDMLTTKGISIDDDIEIINELGFEIKKI